MTTAPADRGDTALRAYTEGLGCLLGAGVPLARALTLQRETTPDPALTAATGSLLKAVLAGETLSTAMAAYGEPFGPLYVAFVRAGEVGGALDVALLRLADLLARESELRSRLRTLAAATRGHAEGATIAARTDEALALTFEEARPAVFLWNLELMLSAGVPVGQAVEVAADALSPDAARAVRRATSSLGDATVGLADALRSTDALPPVALQLIALGDETGSLPQMLLRAHALLMDASVALGQELLLPPR
jgi:type II secretory pathway component PulF